MPRTGIEKSDVKQAMQRLISRSEKVTVERIRHELGDTGSLATIHRHLKELRTEGGANTNTHLLQQIPEGLRKQSDEWVSAVWYSATQKAMSDIENIRTSARQEVEQLETDLDEALANIERLEEELEATEARMRRMADQATTLKIDAKSAEAERDSIKEMYANLVAKINVSQTDDSSG